MAMDKVLKQRLIGASILIALAVIFIPMLLVDPDAVQAPSSESFDVPEMPPGGGEVRRIPLDPTAAGQADAAPESRTGPARRPERPGPEIAGQSTPAQTREPPADRIVLRPELRESGAGAEPAQAADAAVPTTEAPVDAADSAETGIAADDTNEPSPAAEPEPPAKAAGASPEIGDWVVQVASFGSEVSANEVRARLEVLGHVVRRDELVRGDSVLYRLRTGPYLTRAAAEQALAQIQATVAGVEPIVRQIDDPAADGLSEPGFAVQVGSFAGQDNAERETQRLIQLGFEAFRISEQVGDRLIWRVLVGPAPDRDAAEALKARVLEQAGVEGLIVSQPY